ncbi:MAG: hypothetical protein CMJ58_06205 [Planctomycetaceae bacterium]|nr:hypothetical protein [Planctomycetaceae bacterium]
MPTLERLESRCLLDAGLAGELTSTPALDWSSYFGTEAEESVTDVAIDSNGDILIVGSINFNDDAYVAKLAGSDTATYTRGELMWENILGGDSYDRGFGVAVDADDNVIVVGETNSQGWISGGYDTSLDRTDGFVVKFSSAGEHLWSTYVTDIAEKKTYETLFDVDLDAESNIVVVGQSLTFNPNDSNDAFAAKISGGGQLVWAQSMGGPENESARGVAIDDVSGAVYLTGRTPSPGSSEWIRDGFDTTLSGTYDAYLIKLDASGTHLWSTFLGGDDSEMGYKGVAVDHEQNVVVAGITESDHWNGWESIPIAGSYQGGIDGYVAKFNSEGVPQWACYLGGDQGDTAYDLTMGTSGDLFVGGSTTSSEWMVGGFDLNYGGIADSFVAALSADGGLVWSSYLGGINDEGNAKIAVDTSGNLVVASTTESPNSPAWIAGGYDTTYGGVSDAFVAKIRLGEPAPPEPGVTVTPVAGLETSEAGDAAAFDVVLDTPPQAPVTINVSTSDDSEGEIDGPTTLVFDDTNWDVPQTVTIRGVNDDDLDGDVNYTIRLEPAVSADSNYNGVDPADVSVTNLDDEAPPAANEIYVWDIRFETQGVFTTIVVEVRQDSNLNEVADDGDAAAVGVLVDLALSDGTTLSGYTDGDGIFRSPTYKKLADQTLADVTRLDLADLDWNSLLDQEDDTDGDGWPDDAFAA